MEDDIHKNLSIVMFRGTPCIRMRVFTASMCGQRFKGTIVNRTFLSFNGSLETILTVLLIVRIVGLIAMTFGTVMPPDDEI